MKLNLTLVISIVLAVGLVAMAFTIYQTSNDRAKLSGELEVRTSRVADEFIRNNLKQLEQSDTKALLRVTDSLVHIYHITGVAIYYNNDSIVTPDSSIRSLIANSLDYISSAISSDTSISNYFNHEGRSIYQYIRTVNSRDRK